MRAVFAVIGVSLATIGFVLNFGLLYFGIAVYYVLGLEHGASFIRAVSHYQPHLSLYTALAMLVGLVLYGIVMLSESGETNVLPPRARRF